MTTSRPDPAAAPAGYAGRGFVYVLAMSGPEDLLKIGLTSDPLQRWSSFHPRWFDTFDLEHSLLVETERRADAQRLETSMHRALTDHRCPAPLTIRLAAGGRGEWYRGAWRASRDTVERLAGEGHVVHMQALEWLRQPMRAQRDRLFELLLQAQVNQPAGGLDTARKRALQDLVDAHRMFNPVLEQSLPDGLLAELGIV